MIYTNWDQIMKSSSDDCLTKKRLLLKRKLKSFEMWEYVIIDYTPMQCPI